MYLVVGVFGVVLYGSLATGIATMMSQRLVPKRSWARLFHPLALTVCLCEIPRYVMLIVLGRYTCRWAYALHLLGTWVYFTCLSVLVYSVSSVVGVNTENEIRCLQVLKASNIFFFFAMLGAVFVCFTVGDGLKAYFATIYYAVYSITDVLKNLVLETVVFVAARTRLLAVKSYARSMQSAVLERQLSNLLRALKVCCLAFALRAIMIVVKLYEIHVQGGSSFGKLQLYGIWWDIFADFVPRTAPILAFLAIFTHRPGRRSLAANDDAPGPRQDERGTSFPDGEASECRMSEEGDQVLGASGVNSLYTAYGISSVSKSLDFS